MKIYILIGNIASGKSSWISKNYPNAYIISKDNIRKSYYKFTNIPYIYNDEIEPLINNIVQEKFKIAIKLNIQNIIIDETNMSIKSRLFFIQQGIKNKIKIIGIVFPTLTMDEHINRRLKNNHGNTSKEKWEEVFKIKESLFDKPLLSEGFSEIIYL